jgi:UDP-GlcNAc:undecaprenyl-phosphate GlcNAc-1-phosphate transferase
VPRIVVSLISLTIAVAWHILFARLAPCLGLVKPNFRKTPVMASYGLVEFPYIAAVAVTLGNLGWTGWRHVYLYLCVMATMWLLGAIDDIWGTREVGGFKGHFRKLFVEHKLTTGVFKALGGGVVALGAGYWMYRDDPVRALLAAAVIALATNLINLFDLRPGRAVAVLFSGLVVTYIVKYGRLVALPLVGAIAAIAVLFGVADSRGKAMMGDSGSNSLGAALGITIALSAPNWMIPAIIVMAAVHVYSEKRSISGMIERNRVLREIDRRLGVR